MKKAGVVGAGGFAGIQAVSILNSHPEFELIAISSVSNEGMKLEELYPSFTGTRAGSLVFLDTDEIVEKDLDVVFLAVPHKASLSITPRFIDKGVAVIDLSADFRIEDPAVYEKWYGVKHDQLELLKKRSFGLPELFSEEINNAHENYLKHEDVLVACAGCYVTASTLAAKPFVESELFDNEMPPVIDAISGLTGAGKKATEKSMYVNVNENYSVYGVTKHRHTPEMEQILGTSVVFTPHLAPANRGILSTVTMKTKKDVATSAEEIHSLYDDFYKDSNFVKVLPLGQFPQTSSVTGTNFAHIGIAFNEELGIVIAIAAIDNLVKGAAGQGVQCANIVFGFDEMAGLANVALPV
ncbi:N-acetyl-gamma-glutamyl-phosphate reductase [Phoenicibacter congonensis]|uniref:N-acetyl-gamma-glutamyl-phosphate reductase n=1 Tax=Phoenicibacter congonensis TaxID=1944646 RepID=UPI0009A77A2F|nr:N-acetyl-gamma-glutamyl-phosphate reductase [Phoenicibacter congonensis]